jgi:hypothetical protein
MLGKKTYLVNIFFLLFYLNFLLFFFLIPFLQKRRIFKRSIPSIQLRRPIDLLLVTTYWHFFYLFCYLHLFYLLCQIHYLLHLIHFPHLIDVIRMILRMLINLLGMISVRKVKYRNRYVILSEIQGKFGYSTFIRSIIIIFKLNNNTIYIEILKRRLFFHRK